MEEVKALLSLQLGIQSNVFVGDLIVCIDQIQLFNDSRELSELALANSKDVFNDVLDALADGSLMEDGAEPFEDTVEPFRREGLKDVTAFCCKLARHLNAVVSGSFEEKGKDL